MWTATTRGFFSAVQHRDDPSLLVVRTRDHADAATLRDWYAAWQADMAKIETALKGQPVALEGPTPTITSYEVSDYPWRVIMPRSAWGAFLAESVEDLDYGNFKDAVKATQGADRAAVYANVWAALLRLETLDPLGRRPEYDERDEPWDLYDDWERRQDEPFPTFSDLDLSSLDEDEDWPEVTAAQVTAYLEDQERQEGKA